MQEYQVKRGHTKDLGGTVETSLTEGFGVRPEKEGSTYAISYGALSRMEVSIGEGGKTVTVTTISRKDADEATILDTNRRFRTFLDRVTGFSSKERVKRAKKAIEEE
ncbi:MAG: DUF5611 family protein [Methanomicrobiales archaeon]|nr:DUF5611 family protein [Methanomicrobiales archaeon]